MKTFLAVVVSVAWIAFGGASPVRAQTRPEKGGNELEVWSGGGHGTNGITQHTGVWTAGARYGWILTGPRGPGWLRGRYEYAVDIVPVFVVFLPSHTAYGISVVPIAAKWNLATSRRIVPYFDLEGGVLFTNRQVPAGTLRVNFTPSAAFGMHFPGGKYNISAEVRFMHISNAGLYALNPGINTLGLRIGVGKFTRGRGH